MKPSIALVAQDPGKFILRWVFRNIANWTNNWRLVSTANWFIPVSWLWFFLKPSGSCLLLWLFSRLSFLHSIHLPVLICCCFFLLPNIISLGLSFFVFLHCWLFYELDMFVATQKIWWSAFLALLSSFSVWNLDQICECNHGWWSRWANRCSIIKCRHSLMWNCGDGSGWVGLQMLRGRGRDGYTAFTGRRGWGSVSAAV